MGRGPFLVFLYSSGTSAWRRRAPPYVIIAAMKRLAGFLLLCFSIARSDAARPLTLEDYYRIVSASAPAISPDGRWVAFVRNSIVEAENRRHTEIWISPADGLKTAVRFGSATQSASAPKWSPARRLLTFPQRGRAGAG